MPRRFFKRRHGTDTIKMRKFHLIVVLSETNSITEEQINKMSLRKEIEITRKLKDEIRKSKKIY